MISTPSSIPSGTWRTAKVFTRLFDGEWLYRSDKYTFGTCTVRPEETLEQVRRRVAEELDYHERDVRLELV